MFFKSKEKSMIEFHIQAIKMNVENNYMDLAKIEYKEAEELLNSLKENRKISERAYEKYSVMLGRYSFVSKDSYGHTNISKFLKERG